MATLIHPGDEVFLDTSYAIAISSPKDELHDRALALALELEAAKARITTTRAVTFEIGSALAKRRFRESAVILLQSFEDDDSIEIVPTTRDLYANSLELFAARRDKEWGLVDCCSFVVMEKRNLRKALTADEHFVQAGFQALLRMI